MYCKDSKHIVSTQLPSANTAYMQAALHERHSLARDVEHRSVQPSVVKTGSGIEVWLGARTKGKTRAARVIYLQPGPLHSMSKLEGLPKRPLLVGVCPELDSSSHSFSDVEHCCSILQGLQPSDLSAHNCLQSL